MKKITSNPEKLFAMACCGCADELENYYKCGGAVNVRYEKFGKEHSLLMGAYNNQQYDTIKVLKAHGETLTAEEQEHINSDYKKIRMLEMLQNISSK